MEKELKQALNKEKKIIFGSKRTLKNLVKGNICQIFLASNVHKVVRDKVYEYAELSGKVKITDLKETKEELKELTKKPFTAGVISVLSE